MKINSAAEFGRLSVEAMLESIRTKLKRDGVSYQEFAARCGMRPHIVSTILNWHRSPTAEELIIMYSMSDKDVYDSMLNAIDSMDNLKRMELLGR